MHFHLPSRAIIGAALAAGFALSGCGGGGSSSSSTASTTKTTSSAGGSKAESVPAHPHLHRPNGSPLSTTIDVGSPAVGGTTPLPTRYTCDGANTSLPISWGTLPPRTTDVALFLITAGEVHGELGLKSIDWAVANLNPSTHGIGAGHLPAGALVGSNELGSKGYSICPAKGSSGNFAVLLYALPRRLVVKSGFNAVSAREQAAANALAGGVFTTSYKRR